MINETEEKKEGTIKEIYDLTGASLCHVESTEYISVEISGDFEKAKNWLEDGWYLKKEIEDGLMFKTEIIEKLWEENNKYHAITKNGTHYIF